MISRLSMGVSSPLSLARYAFSKDRSKLLVFTNTKRVWRHDDRGDYWVLDRSSLGLPDNTTMK